MSRVSAGHRCPGCGSHRVVRRGLHGWLERTVLPRFDRHSYQCLECARRFWDRPYRRQSYAPPPPVKAGAHRRRRPRWRVEGTAETTPYSRARIYLAIGLAWVVVLALFVALRILWPAGEAVVRSVD